MKTTMIVPLTFVIMMIDVGSVADISARSGRALLTACVVGMPGIDLLAFTPRKLAARIVEMP